MSGGTGSARSPGPCDGGTSGGSSGGSAAAVAAEQGPDAAASYVVHVPGGRVRVDLEGADAYLTGPAEIVYTGSIVLPDPEGIHD